MHTLQFLQTLFAAQDEGEQRELCEYLESSLRSEPLENRAVEGVVVNVPALSLLALASFGPIEKLVEAAFSRISSENPKEALDWASEIGQGLRYCLPQYEDRFSDRSLEEMKSRCLSLHPVDRAIPLPLLQSLRDLEKMIEVIELDRFEQSLRQSTKKKSAEVSDLDSLLAELGTSQIISTAMKKAESSLHGPGEFDPKIAADLMRSSMDVLHTTVVEQLEKIYSKPCSEKAKDGFRRAYMRDVGFISVPEEKFFSCIYTLMSEEASHKLIAPKETVMVLFRTVRDYIILILRRLSLLRRGTTIV
jgi:hypothetical protein